MRCAKILVICPKGTAVYKMVRSEMKAVLGAMRPDVPAGEGTAVEIRDILWLIKNRVLHLQYPGKRSCQKACDDFFFRFALSKAKGAKL